MKSANQNNKKISIYISLFLTLAIPIPSIGENSFCLGGVCIGDSVEKLSKQTWVSGGNTELISAKDCPRTQDIAMLCNGVIGKLKGRYPTINEPGSEYITEDARKSIDRYVFGLSDKEKLMLSPYYWAMFFDNNSLGVISKATDCFGYVLNGFKQAKDGGIDMVSIAPSVDTGKYEVVSIGRQLKGMEEQQKEQLLLELKAKYPFILDGLDIRGPYTDSVMYWDKAYNTLVVTKVFEFVSGFYSSAIKGGDFEKLRRSSICSPALMQKQNID